MTEADFDEAAADPDDGAGRPVGLVIALIPKVG